MNIEILKKPSELNKNELASVFKIATGFDFKEYCIEEFEIKHNETMFYPVTSISCKNTGYSAHISEDYSIKVESSIKQLSNKTNILGIANVLFKNNIIKISE